MFGFLLKKTFFDSWDHLFAVVLFNLGFVAVIAGTVGLSYLGMLLLPLIQPLAPLVMRFSVSLLIAVIGIAVFCVYMGAVSSVTRVMADYEKADFRKFLTGLKATWKPSLIFGIIQGILLGLLFNAADFYLGGIDNAIFPFIFFALLWIYVTWLVASQWFFPIQSRFDKKLRKNIRKMFLLMFDNTAFSIFGMALVAVIMLVVSPFLFFFYPSFTVIQLFYADAFKLRLLKYEYLEKNPEANRRKIPWETLLVEERELVGRRTFKGMIFPWKNQ